MSSVLVLSGPSGVGKTTIAKEFQNCHKDFIISISATTRPRRNVEKDGIDYKFMDESRFKKGIESNEFLEYEQVYGYFYGTPKSHIDTLIKSGKSIIFDIDVNGAMNIKRFYPGAVMIFIKPPSYEELRNRLIKRKSENHERIKKRLQRLSFEYDNAKNFDYIIVNEHLGKTIKQIEDIVFTVKDKQ